jgi:predicted RNase H-like HicB family nuclease
MRIETDREKDGRAISEVPELPGVVVYGKTPEETINRVEALAVRAIADRLDHGETVPELDELSTDRKWRRLHELR